MFGYLTYIIGPIMKASMINNSVNKKTGARYSLLSGVLLRQ